MKKLMISLCLFLTLGVSQSKAGLLLEPYVGAQIYTEDVGLVSIPVGGISFGGRVGYQTFGLMLGGVYEMTPSRTNSINDTEVDWGSMSKMGVFAGYNFPFLLRVWGSYFFNITSELADGTDTSDLRDGAISGGVGLTFLPLVSLNLEYRQIQVPDSQAGREEQEILLSLSLPLNL